MIRSILSVGGWTLVSRATGFARDVVMAAIMGAGPLADAFVVAFRLPNHFRAIFGEGAFNAAFVPAYTHLDGAEGRETARRFADRVFTLMLIVQVALLALAWTAMPLVVRTLAPGFSADPTRFDLAVALTRITFPYLLFVTLVTLVSAVLNADRRFAAAAAAPVVLNVSIVLGLLAAGLFPSAAHAAAWAVTIAGLLEFVLLWLAARRVALEPRPAKPTLADAPMRGFFRALGPAVIGSAGVQIALFADTIIASLLPAGAVAALYYAERLNQLPIGVIGIAAGTVLLPEMSRRLARGDEAGARAAQARAAGFTLVVAAPFAVAFLTLPEMIVATLFQRGAFDSGAAARAAGVLAAYGAGLPAAVLIRSAVASFYARKDTATPLIASLAAVGVNVLLKVVLTGPFGVVGLAAATSVGAWVNLLLLVALALRRGWAVPDRLIGGTLGAVAAASLALAFVPLTGLPLAERLVPAMPLRELAVLALLGVVGLAVYVAALLVVSRLLGVRIARR